MICHRVYIDFLINVKDMQVPCGYPDHNVAVLPDSKVPFFHILASA